MTEWKSIVSEYKREIAQLWSDIEDANRELKKTKNNEVIKMLEKSLDFSKENVKMILHRSTAIKDKESQQRMMKVIKSRKESRKN